TGAINISPLRGDDHQSIVARASCAWFTGGTLVPLSQTEPGPQNNSLNASSTDRTPTTRKPRSFSSPEVFDDGMTIFLNPSAWASRARTDACVAPRTSPVRPTSPNTAVCASIG